MILLYHRVADVNVDPWSCVVSPDHFHDHLEVIRNYGTAIPLQEAVKRIRSGRFPRRRIVVTFDDGYVDNLFNAKPILEKFSIPATVFVATGYIGGQREFWWDALDRIFLQPNSLPGELSLSVSGTRYDWNLTNNAVYTKEEADRDRQWKASEKPPSERQRVFRSIWELLHPLTERERRRSIDDLLTWARMDPTSRSAHRAMTPEEVRELGHGGLIEIGAHSVTHSSLGSLSSDEQRYEVRQSKVMLEEILGRPVNTFAYPYGAPRDFNGGTIAAVKEAGFEGACTTARTYVSPQVDLFQLPRIYVPDWNGEQFDRFLFDWFNG